MDEKKMIYINWRNFVFKVEMEKDGLGPRGFNFVDVFFRLHFVILFI